MDYIKRHKEIIPFIIVAFVFFIAAYNLFQEQKKRSQLISSGAIVLSSGWQCQVARSGSYKTVKDKNLNGIQHKIDADSLNMDVSLLETHPN